MLVQDGEIRMISQIFPNMADLLDALVQDTGESRDVLTVVSRVATTLQKRLYYMHNEPDYQELYRAICYLLRAGPAGHFQRARQ